jgi:tetratricopeptide (TPR) repeat protein
VGGRVALRRSATLLLLAGFVAAAGGAIPAAGQEPPPAVADSAAAPTPLASPDSLETSDVDRSLRRTLERAELAWGEGRWEDAAGFFERAARAPAASPGFAMLSLSNAAVSLARAGRTAAAGRRLREAAVRADDLPPDQPDAAFVLANWAQWQLEQGLWEGAEAVAARAEGRARNVVDHPVLLRSRRIVAESRRLLGRWEDAFEAARTARAVHAVMTPDQVDSTEVGELSLVEAMLRLDREKWDEAIPALEDVARDARRRGDRALRFRAQLALAEAGAGAGLVNVREAALRRARALAGGPHEIADVHQRRIVVARREGRFGDIAREIERCFEEADRWIADAPDADERRSRRRVARGYVDTALEAWAATGPAEEIDPEPPLRWIRGHRIRGRVPPGNPVPPATRPGDFHAVWFWGAERVRGVVGRVEADGTIRRRFVDAGESERLREWILLFRSLLADPSRTGEREDLGRLLRDALLPGLDLGPTARLLVEPDGPLTALPFAALPGPGEARDGPGALPLGIRHAVLRWYESEAAGSTAGPPREARLVLADPGGDEPGSAEPVAGGPLPGARREAEVLAREDPRAAVLLGHEAREARVKVGDGEILHVAAHSSTDPDDPALLLAPGDGEDGRLTPEEIRGLVGVPALVVLSSCESLLADVSGRSSLGEIGRAFLEAGSSNVFGALWKVEDEAQPDFLGEIHARLRAGAPPSEALRSARESMYRSNEPSRRDPFLWAAITVEGNDRRPATAVPARAAPGDPRAAALGWAAAAAFLGLLVRLVRSAPGRSGRSPAD